MKSDGKQQPPVSKSKGPTLVKSKYGGNKNSNKVNDKHEACLTPSDDDSNEESPSDYKKGGYHPVKIGDKFKNRYTVLMKLGWGHFSTVWLVSDSKTNELAAMKIMRSAKTYTESAIDEIKLLSDIHRYADSKENRCVRILDHFDHRGPHGCHVVLIFEVLGDNLLTLIRRYGNRPIPLPIVKNITRQMLEAMAYFHDECHIIHTDFKPENVMMVEPLKDRSWTISADALKSFMSITEAKEAPDLASSTPPAPITAPVSNAPEADTKNLTEEAAKEEAGSRTDE
eukprot:CAMPEP_0175070112 /NCGR_PEP_ID=MMETSP0052_2-20121109/18542_1 /TAXON_ID=51329 ORGANISM="Polytomella parva, Strain SAG 63-3" /NCGR_SAMPLE_ID=MMETSP0052_2 /ASSEMBLY_ACC=CAM_ASM_000194 /LENGTH=283 /DNA_ID=CAMNT_0016337207 /DNA_START=60 /DNA_END=911 /DNA_ORIENTATION=-